MPDLPAGIPSTDPTSPMFTEADQAAAEPDGPPCPLCGCEDVRADNPETSFLACYNVRCLYVWRETDRAVVALRSARRWARLWKSAATALYRMRLRPLRSTKMPRLLWTEEMAADAEPYADSASTDAVSRSVSALFVRARRKP